MTDCFEAECISCGRLATDSRNVRMVCGIWGVVEGKDYLLLTARRFRSPKFIAFVKSWNVRIVGKDVKLHDAKLRVKKYQVHISGQQ